MSSFVLKIIGIITMLCDHYGDAIIGHFSVLNIIGRLAFPIFAYQIAQGYIHTKNLKKYMLRMLAFACISQLPFYLFLSVFTKDFTLNVFFTFLIALLALYLFEKIDNKFFATIVVIILGILANFLKVDYGAFGVAIIFIFYIYLKIYEKQAKTIKLKILCKLELILIFLIIVYLKYVYQFINYIDSNKNYVKLFIGTACGIIPILLHNGKQGPKCKYLFYIFYPLHLILLWAVNMYLL